MKRKNSLMLGTFLAAALLAPQGLSAQGTMSGFAAFQGPVSPSAEVPPVEGLKANGEILLLVHMQRGADGALTQAIVDFNISYLFGQEETIVGMHVHRGARGSNGPVVINSNFGMPMTVAPGARAGFRQVIISDQEGLDAVQAFLDDPGGHYLNLHTQNAPPGLLRGQLHPVAFNVTLQNNQELKALRMEVDRLNGNMNRVAKRLGIVPGQ